MEHRNWLNYTTNNKMCFLLPFFFIFNQKYLPNIHEIMFALFSSSNLLLVWLLQLQHKRDMGVYKVLIPMISRYYFTLSLPLHHSWPKKRQKQT